MTERERLIELLNKKYDHFCDQCGVNKDSHYTENLADYLIANGVIVPPCKVGDTVWCIVDGFYEVMEGIVRRFTKGENYVNVYCGIRGYFEQVYNAKEFGVKIFRCKEKAEKALKEREG